MANDFSTTVVIDRPIAEVFAFLADGTNSWRFPTRVLEIAKTTERPPGSARSSPALSRTPG